MTAIPEFHLSYKRYYQVTNPDYESMFYRILLWDSKIPGIVIDVTYDAMPDKYEFRMYKNGKHVASAYMYMDDLDEFESHGYKPGSTKGRVNGSTIHMPTTTIAAATATNSPTFSTTTNKFINPKDKIMNNNFSEYDADTIDAMIDTLLQKKAELDAIESRWKKDEDFNNGDVIVVEYAYSADDDAKVYTGALLKTPVGWFTTLETTLLGANKYSQVVKFFENRCVKKVTYLALSEGVEMFSNVDKSDATMDDEPPF